MPVYNGQAFLADAMRNLRAQDHAFLEIIAIDGGSLGCSRGTTMFGICAVQPGAGGCTQ